MGARRLIAAASLWAAACQPLPHPFAEQAPRPGSPILALPNETSIEVAPVRGEPSATAAKLAPAMANALQQHEIAASDRTAALGSYRLAGTLTPMPASGGKEGVFVLWELSDPSGQRVGERAYGLEAGAGDWRQGKDEAVARLAAGSAERLAGLLLQDAPASAAATAATADMRPRLAIGQVTGAPGDGGQALAGAIRLLLTRQDVAIATDATAKADFVLDAEVAIDKPKAGKQHVKIVWHVRRAKGGEIGTVGQENDVPTGLLDAAWGDVAYTVAASAQDAIMQLLERAGPPPAAATAGAAAPAGKS